MTFHVHVQTAFRTETISTITTKVLLLQASGLQMVNKIAKISVFYLLSFILHSLLLEMGRFNRYRWICKAKYNLTSKPFTKWISFKPCDYPSVSERRSCVGKFSDILHICTDGRLCVRWHALGMKLCSQNPKIPFIYIMIKKFLTSYLRIFRKYFTVWNMYKPVFCWWFLTF